MIEFNEFDSELWQESGVYLTPLKPAKRGRRRATPNSLAPLTLAGAAIFALAASIYTCTFRSTHAVLSDASAVSGQTEVDHDRVPPGYWEGCIAYLRSGARRPLEEVPGDDPDYFI